MNFGSHLRLLRLGGIILACTTCVTTSAFAVDGVVLIDQARALAGNVTPGDAPGFPVAISLPGSYRLSGNLNVPAATTGIVIAADNVTLDLNGFQIAGNNKEAAGVADLGIRRGIVVRNGSVTNFASGIALNSPGTEIAQIRAFDNVFAMEVGSHAIVTGSSVSRNISGIFTGGGSLVTGNNIFDNEANGLQMAGASAAINNTIVLNTTGIVVNCPANLVANTVLLNSVSILAVGDGCTRANNNPVP